MGGENRYAEYDAFAWLYDRYWSRGIPFQLLGAVERLLLPHLPPGGRVLDLCCGTGRIAAALAERGFRVTGIDGSEEMLRLARGNAPTAEFIAADARAFDLPASFDGVVSLFDSLNHILSAADLAQVFRNVHAALVEGGRFVFDLNVERSFQLHWRGDSFATVEADHASIVRGTYDARTRVGRLDITLFRPREGAWHRDDLQIVERCHPEDEVVDALRSAGFRDVAHFDAERELEMPEQVGRIFFAARK